MYSIPKAWKDVLEKETRKPYFLSIVERIASDERSGVNVYPPLNDRFKALNLTPPENVKCVIIGQDPYFQPDTAMGLSFSVKQGQPIPRSLKNIFKEIESDLGIPLAEQKHGDLTSWAKQGVLLLNDSLTVQEGLAGSHSKIGWSTFTDKIIESINLNNEHVVFILWGNDAIKKCQKVDTSKHLIIQSSHPSPLSARRSFFGSKPFSRTNEYLSAHGKSAIDWRL